MHSGTSTFDCLCRTVRFGVNVGHVPASFNDDKTQIMSNEIA